MASIKTKQLKQNDNGWEFQVEINEDSSKTKHKVILTKDYYDELVSGDKIEPVVLVEKSIEFLLERESKNSIMSEFDLKIINNYFPEYEDEIKERF